MGSGSSTELAMTEVDFETYTGARYCIEVPNTREPTRGSIFVSEPLELDPRKMTLRENLHCGVAIDNGTRPCFGTRRMVNGVAGEYEWLTYNEVFELVEVIAAGLVAFAGIQRQQPVGVFSKNRVEWCLTSHACNRMAFMLVPLYDTLGPDAVPYIVNHTELTTLLCGSEQLPVVLECKDMCPTLQYVVQFENVTADQRRLAQAKGLQLKSLAEIQELGRRHPIPEDAPLPEDIATICYTSGTTGNPKGVILTHKNMTTLSYSTESRLRLHKDMVHLSYLPLPHVFERAVMSTNVRLGASSGFYQGDVLKLLDDMAMLQPTHFMSVPRLLNRVYDKITQGIVAAGGVKKMLYDQAYAAKKAALADGYKTHAFWDALVFSKVQQVLGGRVELILSGSAPLSPDVKEFLQIVFACDIVEGYGLSETAAGMLLSSPDMPLGAHVGTPLPNHQVRLEDVPEMGYTSNDKPRPRGEILCKGPLVFSGYYKEPEKTAEALDKDGWFHTGDIGCWNANGTVSIIDRKKNIFKLSQGEYVAAEKIEGVYSKSKFVAQIFVYGDSFQDVLVAIVVPDPEVTQAWGLANSRSIEDATPAKLANDPEFMKEIVGDLMRIGKEAQLRGFEIVKKLHLHPDAFSVDEGLITPTFKLKRPQLKARFQGQIDSLYASLKQ